MAYYARTLRLLALAQMIMGSLMIVFGIASIFAVPHWSSYVGFGIWVGVWVLVTGILGYVGARNDTTPNKCLIGTFMGFAITSIVLAGVVIICIGIALSEFSYRLNRYYHYYNYDYGYNRYYYGIHYYTAKNGAGIGSCILILAVAEFFVAMASSVYCCNAVCCGTPGPSPVAVNQQIMYLPQQQGAGQMVVMNPPGAVPMQTVPASQPMYMQGQPSYYVTTSGVPVSAAGGVPMVVTSQPGQPAYFGNPSAVPVSTIPPTSTAGISGQAAGTAYQGAAVEMPPAYKSAGLPEAQ